MCCGYHGTAGLLFNFLVFISSHNSFYICCWWCLVTKLCLTLCDSMDCNLPGSSVHGILRARILEWVAISFSRGSSPSRDRTHVSCIGRQFLYHIEPPEKPQSTQGYSLRSKQALPYQGQITVEICLCVISWQVISLPFSLENYL